LQSPQSPGGLENRRDRHTDDPVFVFVAADHPLRFGVQLRPVGIGRQIPVDGQVFGQGMVADLGVTACAIPGLIPLRPPADPPLVGVFIQVLVVGVGPTYRGKQHIDTKCLLQLVFIATAVGIVVLQTFDVQIRFQAMGELRREADLHGTAVRFLVIERGHDSFSVFHPPSARCNAIQQCTRKSARFST